MKCKKMTATYHHSATIKSSTYLKRLMENWLQHFHVSPKIHFLDMKWSLVA